jgi:hypothetical protein
VRSLWRDVVLEDLRLPDMTTSREALGAPSPHELFGERTRNVLVTTPYGVDEFRVHVQLVGRIY